MLLGRNCLRPIALLYFSSVPLLNFLLEVKNFVTDPKGVKTSKNKKKNRRKKEQQKNSSLKEASELNKKVVFNALLYSIHIIKSFSTMSILNEQGYGLCSPKS